MCFSAAASFVASAAILVVAAVSLRVAKTKGGFLVASIPLIFSIQQALEGLLWISLRSQPHRSWQEAATFGFLIFAQVIWPALIPLMVWALERPGYKKKVLALFSGLGCATGLYFLWCLTAYTATSRILGSHIRYDLHFPGYNKTAGILIYLVATIIPPLISGNRHVRWLGAILLASLLLTVFGFKGYLISVWCFFATLISLACPWIISSLNQRLPVRLSRVPTGPHKDV